MKKVAVIQARMGSRRFPGKVLQELGGAPLLAFLVGRLRQAASLDAIVVATSTEEIDEPIQALCREQGISCHRGSLEDVLDRVIGAARSQDAEVVIRITGDCPLVDPRLVDELCRLLEATGTDYATNTLPPSFPDGLDVEVMTMAALEQAGREAALASEREHVTPWLRHCGKIKKQNLSNTEHPEARGLRWTADDPEDLEAIRALVAATPGPLTASWTSFLKTADQLPRSTTIMNTGYYHSLYQEAVAGAAPAKKQVRSRELYQRAEKIIPGAAQTFSKSSSQFVQGVSPLFLEEGAGCRVRDVDGNEYVDFIQALLPNILGYAQPEVDLAFYNQARKGHSFSLPHRLEVELAETLKGFIPCAEMVRFGKNGSDATAGAVRAARAFTGRDRVACCGYHGWQDWFIGSTTRHMGVPEAVRGLTHPFVYNDIGSLDRLLEQHEGEFAAIILEPFNFVEPAGGFLQAIRDRADRHGVVLIYDEICSGFHFGLGGAQRLFGVVPDMACYGKAMGNGYPISAIVGRSDIMNIFNDIFVSFTFGGEVASIAATLKVIDILANTDALQRLSASGRMMQDGFNALSREAGLHPQLECVGRPEWSLMKFQDATGKDSLLVRSLFQQEAVKRGILHLVTHNMTAAHDEAAVNQALQAYASIFKTLGGWLQEKDPARHLAGPQIQPVFKVR